MKTLKAIFRKLLAPPCRKCEDGRIWYSHQEPALGGVFIKIYSCDRCGHLLEG